MQTPDLQTALDRGRFLFIQQKRELAEIIIDWETKNRYAVLDEEKRTLGMLAEKGSGLMAFLKRALLRSHRSMEVELVDLEGQRLLLLNRPFFFFFSTLTVLGGDGAVLGEVRRRFGILYRKYDLVDRSGRVFARISSPLWRLWTFPVRGEDSPGEAVISKKWGGLLQEVFTDSDLFGVDYGQTGSWSAVRRRIIFAAAISIDFDFFENNQGSGGVADAFT